MKRARRAGKIHLTQALSPVTHRDSPVSPQGRPPAILLMGPTASGKTELAARLATRFPVEIVSVDSAQVFRHMDIGTAKPDPTARRLTAHHLIDILDPTERYSAARFCEDAADLIGEIAARARIPLLVGGTMLYFKALREGLSALPPADPATRRLIDQMALESGWEVLHAELGRIDPTTAERVEPADAQRIQRALEVYYISGKPMSRLLAQGRSRQDSSRMIAIALEPSNRAVLHRRIERRFQEMLELGLIEEVRRLRETFSLSPSLPSMRAVGYRQTWQYLEGALTLAGLREAGAAATRQLAKRQLTWLRAMPETRRFDCLSDDLDTQVETFLRSELA